MSGDTACADHSVAWRIRQSLNLRARDRHNHPRERRDPGDGWPPELPELFGHAGPVDRQLIPATVGGRKTRGIETTCDRVRVATSRSPWSKPSTRTRRRAYSMAAGERRGQADWNSVQDIVRIGHDGWLFLVGGSNDVLDQYRPDAFPPDHFQAWRGLLEERVRRAGAIGARYFHMPVPEKLTILADRSDIPVEPNLAPALILHRSLRDSPARDAVVDLVAAYRTDPDRHNLYLRTDSHWSLFGCHRPT